MNNHYNPPPPPPPNNNNNNNVNHQQQQQNMHMMQSMASHVARSPDLLAVLQQRHPHTDFLHPPPLRLSSTTDKSHSSSSPHPHSRFLTLVRESRLALETGLPPSSISLFSSLLDSLMVECSESSIKTARRWVFDHCQNPPSTHTSDTLAAIAQYILTTAADCSASPLSNSSPSSSFSKCLHLAYLINDILFNSAHKNLSWPSTLSPFLPLLVSQCSSFITATNDTNNSDRLNKMVDLWKKHGFYPKNQPPQPSTQQQHQHQHQIRSESYYQQQHYHPPPPPLQQQLQQPQHPYALQQHHQQQLMHNHNGIVTAVQQQQNNDRPLPPPPSHPLQHITPGFGTSNTAPIPGLGAFSGHIQQQQQQQQQSLLHLEQHQPPLQAALFAQPQTLLQKQQQHHSPFSTGIIAATTPAVSWTTTANLSPPNVPVQTIPQPPSSLPLLAEPLKAYWELSAGSMVAAIDLKAKPYDIMKTADMQQGAPIINSILLLPPSVVSNNNNNKSSSGNGDEKDKQLDEAVIDFYQGLDVMEARIGSTATSGGGGKEDSAVPSSSSSSSTSLTDIPDYNDNNQLFYKDGWQLGYLDFWFKAVADAQHRQRRRQRRKGGRRRDGSRDERSVSSSRSSSSSYSSSSSSSLSRSVCSSSGYGRGRGRDDDGYASQRGRRRQSVSRSRSRSTSSSSAAKQRHVSAIAPRGRGGDRRGMRSSVSPSHHRRSISRSRSRRRHRSKSNNSRRRSRSRSQSRSSRNRKKERRYDDEDDGGRQRQHRYHASSRSRSRSRNRDVNQVGLHRNRDSIRDNIRDTGANRRAVASLPIQQLSSSAAESNDVFESFRKAKSYTRGGGGGGGGGGACFACGKVGHLAKNCPAPLLARR